MDLKSPANIITWTLAVLGWAMVARVGWELGGRIFGALF